MIARVVADCSRELGIDFQDHVVLVQLREHRRDLPLAVRVVERVVDRSAAVMPSREAVSRSITRSRLSPWFCWSVATSRNSGNVLQLGDQLRRPVGQAPSDRDPRGCTDIACG